MSTTEKPPDYAGLLSAYHRAFAPELRTMVASLPLTVGNRVLDIACGDGAYLPWLTDRVGKNGRVVAVDLSPAFLELAKVSAEGKGVALVEADLKTLPFPEGSFDLAWCAQSLYSLPDPVESVRLMGRAVRPGGTVAVLENDTLHHILLPWPIELELALRAAELVGLVEASDNPRKFYVGRQLSQVFREAGLEDFRKRTWATNRVSPLDAATREFLVLYLGQVRDQARPHLDPKLLEAFDRLTDPNSSTFLADWPDLTLTCIDHVVTGVRPSA